MVAKKGTIEYKVGVQTRVIDSLRKERDKMFTEITWLKEKLDVWNNMLKEEELIVTAKIKRFPRIYNLVKECLINDNLIEETKIVAEKLKLLEEEAKLKDEGEAR